MSVLVLDKPAGPTSFDVTRRVQRLLARQLGHARARDLKVGHGGTLDPLATGVLPICLGEATKLAPFLLEADKAYEAEVVFGRETDTLDAAGAVLAEHPVDGLDAAAVACALDGFRGAITQVPPMYSALKRNGRPLHSYARAGEEVERAPRAVTIHALQLLDFSPPATARLSVRCSKGTYVRVLAADLGRALGTGAHLSALRRTASGPFHLGQAITLPALDACLAAGLPPPLVPLADALAHLPRVTASAEVALALWQGKPVPTTAVGWPDDASGRLQVLRADGTLLAVAEAAAGMIRSVRGFRPGPTAADGALPGPGGPETPVEGLFLPSRQ